MNVYVLEQLTNAPWILIDVKNDVEVKLDLFDDDNWCFTATFVHTIG